MAVVQWARRLRPRFQVGLLGYIRGERPEQNLEILAMVAEKLEQAATTQPVFQLWWVVGALLEAVQANALEGGGTLKRLLGQADRQIKVLYESTHRPAEQSALLRRAGLDQQRPNRRGPCLVQALRAVAGGRLGRARAPESVCSQREIDAHRRRGDQGGPLEGQGCLRHLRAPGRWSHR
jgi:hypothetical protein